MSTNVFLAPCDSPNFDETVSSPVDLDEFPDHPPEFDGGTPVRFWGVREGSQNRNSFEKMQSGDLVLFYQDGNYIATGRIGSTFEDERGWASTTFWGDAPTPLIYTIRNFHSVEVHKSSVNSVFDYVDDYNPDGLLRVADTRLDHRPTAIERALQRYSERHD